jgi:hypothetical protein
VEQVIDVELMTTGKVQAGPPNVTVAPVTNPVPIILTDAPPDNDPALGETLETVGAAL